MKNEIAKLTGAGKEVMVVNIGDKLRGLLYRYALFLSSMHVKLTSGVFFFFLIIFFIVTTKLSTYKLCSNCLVMNSQII